MNVIDGVLNDLDDLEKRIKRLEAYGSPRWVYLTAPLTSTSWDGDHYSTTAKTKIDLSSVFSAPAGIKAVLLVVDCHDTTAGDYWIILSPNDTAYSGMIVGVQGLSTARTIATIIVPCDANGDIYYQINASAGGQFGVDIKIWGYVI